MVAFSFVGCGGGSTLSAETEWRIKQSYLSAMHQKGDTEIVIDDVYIKNYYGTYGDCVVVTIGTIQDGAFPGFVYENVAGMIFEYPDPGKQIIVWKDDNFYGLRDSYADGF